MSSYDSNVQYTEFKDNYDEDANMQSPSMYLSVDDEEKQPFLSSHERYLTESKKFSNVELGSDHFKESWKFGQLCNTDTENVLGDLISEDKDEITENLLNENLKYCTNTDKEKIAKWTKYGCNFIAISISITLIITLFAILGKKHH